jgi:6-phosphogluconolactonase (cycloisomerase 2 family)
MTGPTPPNMPPLPPMPPMGQPDAGGMADMKGFKRRRAIFVVLVLLLLAGIGVGVYALASGGSGGDDGSYDGTVYVESNSPAEDGNAVIAFRYRDGRILADSARTYKTGGSGSQDLTNSGPLDAEGQIAVNKDQTLLFAVNAGSDTIAAFNIEDDGTLEPVQDSPFPSGGQAPVSVTVDGNTLFAANKASDGRRNLDTSPPSYVSFNINADGSLSPLSDPVTSPPGASPTQAFVPPGGDLLFSTELVGPWRAFQVKGEGKLVEAPGSPHKLEPEVFAPRKPRPNVWAQGISKHPTKNLLYASVANTRKLVVYSYDDDGRLELVHSQLDPGATLPCWTEVSGDGRRLYTGNAGSQNISVYDIESDPSNPIRIQQVKLKTAGNPWNFEIDPSGRYLFMVNMRAIRRIPPDQGNTLHTFRIAGDGKLSELPESPVKIPVPVDTNPWGIAVVPKR